MTYWKQCTIAKIYGFILLHIHTAGKKTKQTFALVSHSVPVFSCNKHSIHSFTPRKYALECGLNQFRQTRSMAHPVWGEGDKCLWFGWAAMRVKQTSSSVVWSGPLVQHYTFDMAGVPFLWHKETTVTDPLWKATPPPCLKAGKNGLTCFHFISLLFFSRNESVGGLGSCDL